MNWEVVGVMAEIVGAIAVVVTLIYLAIQVRDSNQQARIATTQVVVDQAARWKELIAADRDLAEVYSKGLTDFVQLSAPERTQFDFFIRARLQIATGALLARDAKLLNPNPGDLEERVIEGEILYMLEQPGFQQWWSTTDRRGISVQIIKLVESLNEYVAEKLRSSKS